MALSITDQMDMAVRAVSMGDVDTLARILTDPATVDIDAQRTAAEKLGLKGGFLSAAVNTFADPTVWLAFLMSKRYPTMSWLTGAIPQRFIGAANEFSGISVFTRPVETYFRGTTVPKAVALAERRKAEAMRIGSQMFEHFKRPNWSNEMETVSMLLEGQPAAGATPELVNVAKSIRGSMEELWGLLKRTQRIHGGFGGQEVTMARAEPFAPHEAPHHLRDYLPHIPLTSDESIMTLNGREALQRLGMGKTKQVLEAFGADPTQVWTPMGVSRLTSDFTRYQAFLNQTQGQIFNPHLFRRQRLNIPLQSQLGQELFVTDLNVVLQKYVHSVSRTYALNAPISDYERTLLATRVKLPDGAERYVYGTNEPLMVQIINEGLRATGHRFRTGNVAGTQIPVQTLVPGSGNGIALTALRDLTKSVSGRLDEGEIIWGNLFAAVGRSWDETVGRATNKQRSEVDQALRAVRRTRSQRNWTNGITQYFYGNTLGLNPWAAMQNLLQPIMTTAPTLGIGPTLKGMSEMRQRMGEYSRNFSENYRRVKFESRNWFERVNEAAQTAFDRSFPELASSGIKPDVRLFDVDPKSVTASRWNKANAAWRTYSDFSRWMLQPFNHAEMMNQATTFFGAKHALKTAIRSGQYEIPVKPNGSPLAGQELEGWLNFEAGNIVNSTQFRPGPGGRTIFQNRLPSFMRMFTSFPVRMFSMMGESTVRGAMAEKELETAGLMARATGGRNLGTLARIYLYSQIAANGARDILGVDLSGSLGITAPLTVGPQGRTPFPFALSPVANTAIGVVSAATDRNIKAMQPMTIPGYGEIPLPKTLVPAGLASNRVIRALRQWRPDVGGFVDDQERLMYRGNESDLIMSMLGVPLDKAHRLRNYVERAESARQRVKDLRRQYAVAATNYDTDTMNSVRQQWAKAFPDLPPFSISDRDIKRYNDAARIPVVERMLKTMGESGSYLRDQIYEVDPDLLAPADMGGFQ